MLANAVPAGGNIGEMAKYFIGKYAGNDEVVTITPVKFLGMQIGVTSAEFTKFQSRLTTQEGATRTTTTLSTDASRLFTAAEPKGGDVGIEDVKRAISFYDFDLDGALTGAEATQFQLEIGETVQEKRFIEGPLNYSNTFYDEHPVEYP